MPEFESIYHEYFRFVWCTARRLGVADGGVDDVVQEIFLVIHAKLHTVQKPEALRSWIYGIARRVASEHRRQNKPTAASGAVPVNLPSTGPSPQALIEQASEVALLYSVLDELAEPKREVFILVELEEMPVPEVARALQIPLNTAYSRLRHARLEFDAALMRRLSFAKSKGVR